MDGLVGKFQPQLTLDHLCSNRSKPVIGRVGIVWEDDDMARFI